MKVKNLLDNTVAIRTKEGVVFLPPADVSFNLPKARKTQRREYVTDIGTITVQADDPDTSILAELSKYSARNTFYITTRQIRDLLHNNNMVSLVAELDSKNQPVQVVNPADQQKYTVCQLFQKHPELSGQ